ncbi:MAG: LptE family protein [Flavobacteriales bacterium]|nr:LptE family protein [Flavobacteriales bacterium]
MNSCYSFSGASIHPDAKTIAIPTFSNQSAYFDPNISQEFTLALQDIFIQRTQLNLTEEQADMTISGNITSYTISSVNVQAGTSDTADSSAQNRLTMTVQVNYESKYEPEKNFQKTYSDYADFEGNKTLNQAIGELVPLLNKRLINQIFNDIAVDW